MRGEHPDLDAPITLDQLRVFLAVIEEGSFSKAAKKLRRVQSAVSYSIANLERLLDVELFDRTGRTPKLTDAGRALVADAHGVSGRVDRLQARARRIASGVEARLSLAVDVLFPLPALVEGLRAFRERFPGVDLHLRTEALGAVAQLVLDGTCQLGVSVELERFPRELSTRALAHIRVVPVCGSDHELATASEPSVSELADAIQIVVTDRSQLTAGRDRGVVSERTWRVADLGTKEAMILAGFGWGLLPAHRARPHTDSGRMCALRVDGWEPPESIPLLAVHRTAAPPGPAGAWLLSQLTERCTEIPTHAS